MSRNPPDWIVPHDLPARVSALMTTRLGGCSAPPWASLNLGSAVGDRADSVAENRARLAQALDAAPVFMRQVHGTRVVRLTQADTVADAPLIEADGCVTDRPGVACTVQVADCLPVLLAAPGGRGVAAAHAGWRGLSAGVVEATAQALCEVARCDARSLWAWLGPCIGPRRFEVGADVLEAFGVNSSQPVGRQGRFVSAPTVNGVAKWHADLAGLARDRLDALGLRRVTGGDWCTVEDPSRFFSFRRDGVTGRMAAAICLRP